MSLSSLALLAVAGYFIYREVSGSSTKSRKDSLVGKRVAWSDEYGGLTGKVGSVNREEGFANVHDDDGERFYVDLNELELIK